MNNTVDIWMFGEDIVESFLVRNIEVDKLWPLTRNEFNAIDHFLRRILEIVCNDDLISSFKQCKSGERADIAGASESTSQP